MTDTTTDDTGTGADAFDPTPTTESGRVLSAAKERRHRERLRLCLRRMWANADIRTVEFMGPYLSDILEEGDLDDDSYFPPTETDAGSAAERDYAPVWELIYRFVEARNFEHASLTAYQFNIIDHGQYYAACKIKQAIMDDLGKELAVLANAPHRRAANDAEADAGSDGYGKLLYAIQYEMGWRHWEGLSADDQQHYADDAAALIEAYNRDQQVDAGSTADRENAIACIAQALAGAYFDFGVGGQAAEVEEGRKIGEHVMDAFALWGWTIRPSDTEADARSERAAQFDQLWRFCWFQRECIRSCVYDLWIESGKEISNLLDALGEPPPLPNVDAAPTDPRPVDGGAADKDGGER